MAKRSMKTRLSENTRGDHYIVDFGPDAKSYIMLFYSADREFGVTWTAVEMSRPSGTRQTIYKG